MNYEDFVQQMIEGLEGPLSDRFGKMEIRIRDVRKLQNASYEGVTFRPESSPVGMTIDFRGKFEAYKEGKALSAIRWDVLKEVERGLEELPRIDVEAIRDYSAVKEHLTMQIVSTAANVDRLGNVPHVEMQDMSVVYRLELGESPYGCMTTLITNEMLEEFGISAEQLHRDALENAPKLHPLEIISMRSFMMQSYDTEIPEASGSPELLIASTEEKRLGASVIAYPNFFEEAARAAGGDYFILPSSIHELLLLRDNGTMDARELEEMVTSINNSIVDPEERLTDNVYRYDTKLHLLETGREFIERTAGREKDSVLNDLKEKEAQVRPPSARTVHSKKDPVI